MKITLETTYWQFRILIISCLNSPKSRNELGILSGKIEKFTAGQISSINASRRVPSGVIEFLHNLAGVGKEKKNARPSLLSLAVNTQHMEGVIGRIGLRSASHVQERIILNGSLSWILKILENWILSSKCAPRTTSASCKIYCSGKLRLTTGWRFRRPFCSNSETKCCTKLAINGHLFCFHAQSSNFSESFEL